MRKGNFFSIILLVINVILFVQIYIFKNDNNNLRRENAKLTVDNALEKEQYSYTNHLIDKNLCASSSPVIIKDSLKIKLNKYLKCPVLFVRYDANSCFSCVSKFLSWIKDVGRKIGHENIILFQVGDNKFDNTIFPDKCKLFKIKEEDLYINNLSTEIPYTFVYDINFKYPLLLFYYPSDIINLDQLYENILIKYFVLKK